MPLRILIVAAGAAEDPSEKHALHMGRALEALGHTVLVSLGGELPPAGSVPRSRRHRLAGPVLRPADIAAARRYRPDLVHAWSSRVPVLAAARPMATVAAAPLFVHFEDSEWALMHLYGLRGQGWAVRRARAVVQPSSWVRSTPASLRAVGRRARALDALTPQLAEHVGQRLGRECAVVPPASPSQRPEPRELELPAHLRDHALLVFAGSVGAEVEADFRLALRAVAALQREGRPTAMLHAGVVATRTALHEMAADAGLENGTLHSFGYLSSDQHRWLLQRGHVLLQPGGPGPLNSLRLPSKLQDYLESGTPVITFGAGVGRQLAEGLEVLITRTGDAGELAGLVARVLDDPALAARLAAGGPAAARRLFDPERNAALMDAHYRAHL